MITAIDIKKEEEMGVALLIISYSLAIVSVLLFWQLGLDPHFLLNFIPFGDTFFKYILELLGMDEEAIYSNDTANGGITDRGESLFPLSLLSFPIIILYFLLLLKKTFKIYQKTHYF